MIWAMSSRASAPSPEVSPAAPSSLAPAAGAVAIEVRGLRRRYGDFEAVRGIDFSVRRGEVFGLLGPNGAGKTTTVEILEGYRTRSGGDARVLGMDPARGERELRERVGIVLQQCGVQSDLTVAELVEMYGRYYERRRPVDELIELVELTEKRDVRAKKLSGGQRRRLDLALALVGDPDLIFLDEPTTGFDAAARRQAWATVRSLCALRKTIFLTTHYMDEAQHLANRVAVMRAGEIIALGRPDELGGRDLRPAEIRFGLPAGYSLGDLPHVPAAERSLEGDTVLLLSAEPVRAAHEITGWALEREIDLERFSVSQPTLEDIYLELTGSANENHVAEEATR
jgi:ABC-2 type transport system ATP-binding protein